MPIREKFLRTIADVLKDLKPGDDEDAVFQRDAAEAHIRELSALAEKPAPDVFVYQRVINAAIEYIATDPEFDAGNWSNAYDKLHNAVKEFTGEAAEKPAERPDTRTYPCGTVANGPAIPEVCPVHGVECEVRMRWEKTCRERAERPQLSVEQVRERVTLLRRYEFKGNGPFVKLEDVMLLLPSALLTGVAEKVSPAPIAHIVGEGGKCWCGERHANYHKPDCKYQETGTCKCAAPAAPPVLQAETPTQLVEWLGGSSRANSVEHIHQRDLAIRREAERAAFEKAAQAVDGWGVFEHEINHAHRLAAAIRALAEPPVSGATKEKAE